MLKYFFSETNMKNLSKKVAYLKGYADGLDLNPKSEEGKLLKKMLEVIDDIAEALDTMAVNQDEVAARVDLLEDDLDEFVEDYYGDEDIDFNEDYEDYEDDEVFKGEDAEDATDFFEIACPSCGEDVLIDFDMIDEDNGIVCPNCHEEIELEFECDCDDDECGGHKHE